MPDTIFTALPDLFTAQICCYRELPPVAVDEVCEVALPMAAASVALSPDETLLAAWDNQNINVWSLGALVNKRDTKPLTEWVLPSGESVKQVGNALIKFQCL